MLTEIEEGSIAKRRLILHDTLAILSLVLGTGVLFTITLFLFRSFTAHRASLAQSWSDTGRKALAAGEPDQAITALRTALYYSPGTRAYELLLAQALGDANCTGCRDESYNYFINLWEAEPGNGSINLALARLAAKRNDRQGAINFYRASIYGTWDEGNGVDRRAEVRLELARYLIQNHDLAAARLELLIAAGNAPDDFDRDMTVGQLLEQADDPADAWTYFQKAIVDKPTDITALETAGQLAYQSGDFEDARHLLARAIAAIDADKTQNASGADDRALMEKAQRILELTPSETLTERERVDRILAARTIAKKRFDSCSAQFPAEAPLPAALEALSERWAGSSGTESAEALRRDPALQDSTMQLVFDTEIDADKVCNAAAGDDALLLKLALTPHNALAGTERPGQAIVPRD